MNIEIQISGDDKEIQDEMYNELLAFIDTLQQKFITRNDKRRAFIDIESINE